MPRVTVELQIIIYRRYSDQAERPAWHAELLINGLCVREVCRRKDDDEAYTACVEYCTRHKIDTCVIKRDEHWWRRNYGR